jgi:hypothetical protein
MTQTEKDAARYRWLIEGDNAWRVLSFAPCDPTEFVATGPGLQHAIDAAMRRDELEGKEPTLSRSRRIGEVPRRVLQVLRTGA